MEMPEESELEAGANDGLEELELEASENDELEELESESNENMSETESETSINGEAEENTDSEFDDAFVLRRREYRNIALIMRRT